MRVATDAEVVRRVLTGDADAYALLVQRHQSAVIASAHHLTGDAEAARDIAQDTFVDAWRQLRQLRNHAAFSGWLVGILRNKCRAWLARRQHETVPLDDVPAPGVSDPDPDTGDVAELLGMLPTTDREILAARFLHELSYAEIADAMEMTVGAVRTRCCRARQHLREILSVADGAAARSGDAR